MTVISIFSGAFCGSNIVATQIANTLGYSLVTDADIIDAASKAGNLSTAKLERLLEGRTSPFNNVTHEKERSRSYLRAAVADFLTKDGLVFYGRAGHLIPRAVSHVLKICLTADLRYRVDRAKQEKNLSESLALRTIHKDDEGLFSWAEYVLHSQPWDPSLYDIVIPLNKESTESAMGIILDNARKKIVQPTDDSVKAVRDFTLSSRVEVALANAGHFVDVTADEGKVTITIKKHVIMLTRLKEDFRKISEAIPGVQHVETKVGPTFYETNIYRKSHFETPAKILLVDDEREFAQTLSNRLLMRDMGSTIAYNGEQALSLIEEEEPDVMILDLKMPGIHGIDVLRQVKEKHPSVKVIVLTGHGTAEDERNCLELGAFAYLQKPVNIETLTATMNAASPGGQSTSDKAAQSTREEKEASSQTNNRPVPTVHPETLPKYSEFKETKRWNQKRWFSLERLKLSFLFETVLPGGEKTLFNYRRIWWQAIWAVVAVSIIPLVIITMVHHNQYRKAMTAEIIQPVARFVSNSKRTITSYLEERRIALDFVVRDNDFETLSNQKRLTQIFSNLQTSFGGFVDIGVIDDEGNQLAYFGPYDLRGKNYKNQNWFRHVTKEGLYLSEIFRGYRNVPHFVVAARHSKQEGGYYILRATIDAARLTDIVRSLEIRQDGDAFIVNHAGVLQTDSLYHGSTLEMCPLKVPPASSTTTVTEVVGPDGSALVLGYVHIQDTPFVFVVTKPAGDLMMGWWNLSGTLIAFLLISTIIIVGVVVIAVTYLVGRVYEADFKRTVAVRKMEHTNKMASVGRLAAGVAHEINNPLAVINEKAGLLKDIISVSNGESESPNDANSTLKIAESILRAVERGYTITHRLLGFAKHVDVVYKPIALQEVIQEVIDLMGKEAEYRNIKILITAEERLPPIWSDLGKLQQIFLNIINNSFDAVSNGGMIDISLSLLSPEIVVVVITDNGRGIAQERIHRIFDPFYTTKQEEGTGLGLSITYGLVQKLGAEISVRSELGKGTSIKIKFPVTPPKSPQQAKQA